MLMVDPIKNLFFKDHIIYHSYLVTLIHWDAAAIQRSEILEIRVPMKSYLRRREGKTLTGTTKTPRTHRLLSDIVFS